MALLLTCMPLVCYEVDVTKVHIVTKEEQLVGYHWQLDPDSRWGKQVRKKKTVSGKQADLGAGFGVESANVIVYALV